MEEDIFLEGDPPSEVYFIVEGKILLKNNKVVFKTMLSGGYFGEVDVIFNQPRGHSASSGTNTDMLSLERNKFVEILD